MRKGLIAMIVTTCAAACAMAEVHYDVANGYEWRFAFTNNGVEICRDGNEPCFSPYQSEDEVLIPSELGGQPVVGIAEGAFSNCFYLARVVLPNGITRIGEKAFWGCHSLGYINIPASVTSLGNRLFQQCGGLARIVFEGNAPSTVGAYCFYGVNSTCTGYVGTTSTGWRTAIPGTWKGLHVEYMDWPVFEVSADGVLTSVMPNGMTEIPIIPVGIDGTLVTAIGPRAFRNCEEMTGVSIPYTVTNISSTAFSDCLNIRYAIVNQFVCDRGARAVFPSAYQSITNIIIDGSGSVTNIGGSAFANCSALSYVKIPGGVEKIGPNAFINCSSLVDVVIFGGSMTNIGYGAFQNCVCLEDINIPASVVAIGGSAFKNCASLADVYIPDSVVTIGDNAFENCVGLAGITITDSVASLGTYAFRGCTNLATAILSEGLTTLPTRLFDSCTALEAITIPGTVTDIGGYAFNNCSNLASVTILDDNIKTIGGYSFQNCTSLEHITIPASVSQINYYAFRNCSSLTNVTFCGDMPTITAAFGGVNPACTFYVPWGAGGWDDTYSGIPVVRYGDVTECQQGAATYKLGNGIFLYDIALNGETSFVVPDGVKNIGEKAFYNCSTLESITIPASVASIGKNAFYGCNSLREVHISDVAAYCGISFANSYAIPFYYAKELYVNDVLVSDLAIPESIVNLHSQAFYNCTNITTVSIPATLQTGVEGFAHCQNLAEIVLADGNLHYLMQGDVLTDSDAKTVYFCSRGKTGLVTLPATATTIASYAFRDCGGITGVSIPEGVTRINQYAFSGCVSLADIVIPQSVTYIGSYAFYGCEALTSINIPAGVTELGSSDTYSGTVFQNCTGIRNATVNQYVCNMGMKKIFPGAYSAITNVTIVDGVTRAGGFQDCVNLENVSMPNTVTDIRIQAFFNCGKIAAITIPDGANSIGTNAFFNCTSLGEVVLPDSVTTIRCRAFANCTTLETVKMGVGLNTLERQLFSGCSQLRRLIFDGDAPPTVEAGTFSVISGDCFGFVNSDSAGWNISIPGNWNGLPLRYLPISPLSDDANPLTVNTAINRMITSGLADVVGVRTAIGGSVAKYRAFKEWADNVKNTRGVLAGEDAAIANTNAAAAFLLGAERLFENAPAIEMGDVVVAKSATLPEVGTSVTLSVTVKDGENAVVCVAEKVKEMFEATTDLAEWNGTAKLEPTVTVVDDGDSTAGDGCVPMRFMVVPGDGTATRAFLRVKVK